MRYTTRVSCVCVYAFFRESDGQTCSRVLFENKNRFTTKVDQWTKWREKGKKKVSHVRQNPQANKQADNNKSESKHETHVDQLFANVSRQIDRLLVHFLDVDDVSFVETGT